MGKIQSTANLPWLLTITSLPRSKIRKIFFGSWFKILPYPTRPNPVGQVTDPVREVIHKKWDWIPSLTKTKWRSSFVESSILVLISGYRIISYFSPCMHQHIRRNFSDPLSWSIWARIFFLYFYHDFPFFDDYCPEIPGKFINILITINHIMLYTKWSGNQPGCTSIVGSWTNWL
jgi:hypothetical protein